MKSEASATHDQEHTDVVVIGAGPSGAICAAMLRQRGWRVVIVERDHFPRFSIGESLLPQCMESLAAAGMLDAVREAAFQHKSGVTFAEGDKRGVYLFSDQFTAGWPSTWQVERANFDHILAKEAEKLGASIRYGETVTAADFSRAGAPSLNIRREDGGHYTLTSRFVCDGSGFGRVLPRLLALEQPADFPLRAALFTHITDGIESDDFERNHIHVGIHGERPDVWFWMIPFTQGRMSIGVVGAPDVLQVPSTEADREQRLRQLISGELRMAKLLASAEVTAPVRTLQNYAVSVPQLHGQDYALLGNAGEFLDPVFSSGVTLGMRSGVLAAERVDQVLRGEAVDWDVAYEQPLRTGLRVFRAFVNAWYAGTLRHVFFKKQQSAEVRRMISSVLAGYVWDDQNPFVQKPERRLEALCDICAP